MNSLSIKWPYVLLTLEYILENVPENSACDHKYFIEYEAYFSHRLRKTFAQGADNEL